MSLKGLRTNSPGTWFILSAVIAAVVAGFLVTKAVWLAAPSVPVLVAREDLEPGQTLTQDKLDVKYYPKVSVPQDRITGKNLDQTVGKHVKTAIAAGDPVRARHVSEISPEGGTIAARLTMLNLPAGWRAMALPAEASKGLDTVPGDRVDIIGVVDVKGTNTTVSKILVFNAPVIYVPPKVDEKNAGGKEGVVVALNSADAERVALAMVRGKVVLVLNPIGAQAGQGTSGVSDSGIFGSSSLPQKQGG